MPRPLKFRSEDVAREAFPLFWAHGFETISVEALTQATGASRQAIYGAFPDKQSLLLACMDAYRDEIVTPAFGPVEAPGAGFAEIEAFFERHIAAAEVDGFPGRGCMIANLSTEVASRDPQVAARVEDHLARMRAGFLNALRGAAPRRPSEELQSWAALLTVAAQGLWSVSRTARNAAVLRGPIAALLGLMKEALPS